jgi:hypothetical protein
MIFYFIIILIIIMGWGCEWVGYTSDSCSSFTALEVGSEL